MDWIEHIARCLDDRIKIPAKNRLKVLKDTKGKLYFVCGSSYGLPCTYGRNREGLCVFMNNHLECTMIKAREDVLKEIDKWYFNRIVILDKVPFLTFKVDFV